MPLVVCLGSLSLIRGREIQLGRRTLLLATGNPVFARSVHFQAWLPLCLFCFLVNFTLAREISGVIKRFVR